MEIITTNIPDLLIIKPKILKDNRGYFFESFNSVRLSNYGLDQNFVQDNESMSVKGVLRGLHYQAPPYAQGKLVRVVKGAVLDVAVDIRSNSPTYAHWASIELNETNKWMYWIPPGFAHGFLSLTADTILVYKCTQIYNKEAEGSIRWNDPDLAIQWGVANPIISDRDRIAPLLANFESPF